MTDMAAAFSGMPSIGELMCLVGRSAVVTGGAKGLGRAIALRLAEAGANVLIGDLDADAGAVAAKEIADVCGARTASSVLDVRSRSSVEATAKMAHRMFGGIGVWVNNAGIFPIVAATQTSDALFDEVLAVNLRGTFDCARAAASYMAGDGRSAVIVNIVSVSGFAARSPGVAAYVASKHGVRGLTSQLAIELAPLRIRVLGVAPAFCATEGTLAGLSPQVRSTLTSRLGRIGVPDDVARVVLFCASDMASFMTGSTLLVDAGELA